MKLLYYPIYALVWLFSRLPMSVLYLLSDMLFLPVYHVIRYRRKLVQRQLADSFPEKSAPERRQIEKRFYHFLCDLVVEYIKLITITPQEMMRRVQFPGLAEAIQTAEEEKKTFPLTAYHYGSGMRARKPGTAHADFGWGGAAGAFASVDVVNNVTIYYAQHVLAAVNRDYRKYLYDVVLADLKGEKIELDLPTTLSDVSMTY